MFTFYHKESVRLSLISLCVFLLTPYAQAGAKDEIASLVHQLGAESFKTRSTAQNELMRRVKGDPRKMEVMVKSYLKKESRPEAVARLEALSKYSEEVKASLPIDVSIFSQRGLKTKKWTAQLGYTGIDKRMAKYKVIGKQVEVDSSKKEKDSVVFCRAHEAKNATHKISMSFELKVLNRSGAPSNLSGIGMLLTDDKMKGGLFFHKDKIVTYPTFKTYMMNTTDGWHHYRVEGEGRIMKVYIDRQEKPALTVRWGNSPDQDFSNLMLFGDTTGTSGGHALWRNITAKVHKSIVKKRVLVVPNLNLRGAIRPPIR